MKRTLAALILVAALLADKPLPGCATIDLRAFQQAQANIRGEEAVIIWDQAHHIEHFIRQASIATDAPGLGFLVPTPTTPELAEADAKIFDVAQEVSAPRLVADVHYIRPGDIASILGGPAVMFSLGGTVKGVFATINDALIVSEQDVGDYHATILDASDPHALGQWLQDNGYVWTPAAEAWLKPYAAAKWKITAFKLIRQSTGGAETSGRSLQTKAVRLSVTTDRPFFPYSEPASARGVSPMAEASRHLNIALLSDTRMQGALADGTPWPGEVRYAGPSTQTPAGTDVTAKWLADAKLDAPGTSTPLPRWLTSFRDLADPRPGTSDLYFSPSADSSPYRETQIDFSLPRLHRFDLTNPASDLLGLAVVLLFVVAPFCCGWRFQKATTGHLPTPNLGAAGRLAWSTTAFLAGFTVVLHGLGYAMVAGLGLVLLFYDSTVIVLLPIGIVGLTLCWSAFYSYHYALTPSTAATSGRWKRHAGKGAIIFAAFNLVFIGVTIYQAFRD